MTAKQKANQARFKKVVAEAKKLRKKNPKLTQAQAVKQAWAMTYSKKNVSVGATKKAKYKVGDKVYRNYDYPKKRSVPGKVIYVSYTSPYLYKLKLPDGFTQYIQDDDFSKRPKYEINEIGAIKKKSAPTKVKAKKGKRTSEMHTDTKSHNVNIRVMSGIGKTKFYI